MAGHSVLTVMAQVSRQVPAREAVRLEPVEEAVVLVQTVSVGHWQRAGHREWGIAVHTLVPCVQPVAEQRVQKPAHQPLSTRQTSRPQALLCYGQQ